MTDIRVPKTSRVTDTRKQDRAAAKKRAVNDIFSKSNAAQNQPKNRGLYPKAAATPKVTPGPARRRPQPMVKAPTARRRRVG